MTGGDVTLGGSGTGTVTMSDNFNNRIFGGVATDRLINENNTIQGGGQIITLLTNNGMVDANISGGTMSLSTNSKINNGTFRASNGGTLKVSADVSGGGDLEADGGVITIAGGRNLTTTGSITVNNGGALNLASTSTMTGSDLTMNSTGDIDIDGDVTLSGNVSFEMTNESLWDWTAGSSLQLDGGAGLM